MRPSTRLGSRRRADRPLYLRLVSRFPVAVLIAVTTAGCAAGAVQRDAMCERSVAIETAVTRTGEIAGATKQMNAAVLRNQLDEDLANLGAALDVAPESIVNDLSTLVERLRNLYGALELLDWDSARFVSDERLDATLSVLDSVNTRRHLARLTDYLLRECSEEATLGNAPPDSVVILPSTSTSMPSLEDPIPSDEELLTAHVSMGTAIAEAEGVQVSIEQAECLGRESDLLAIDSADDDVEAWRRKWDVALRSIFAKCGVSVPDRQEP